MSRDLVVGITVREALTLGCLSEAKLAAGHTSIDNVITGVNVMEVPDVWRWMRGGELLLTAAYAVKDSTDTQRSLIRELSEAQVAALAVKPGKYVERIPVVMIEEADRSGLPIIELPPDLPYMDIITLITTELTGKHARELTYWLEIHDTLTQAMLEEKNLTELSVTLSDLLKNPVIVTNTSWEPIVAANDSRGFKCEGGVIPPDVIMPGSVSRLPKMPYRPRGRARYLSVPLGGRCVAAAVASISSGSHLYGYLIVLGINTDLAERDMLALERAALVIALKFSGDERILEARHRLEGEFVAELIQGATDSGDIAERARAYGLDPKLPHAVCVVSFGQDGLSPDDTDLIKDTIATKVRSCVRPERRVLFQRRSFDLVVIASCTTDSGADSLKAELKAAHTAIARDFRELNVAIGIGSAARSLHHLGQSYSDAYLAEALGSDLFGASHVTSLDDLGACKYLHVLRDSEYFRGVFRETIGSLDDYDREHGTELCSTLRVFFANRENITQTSKSMYVHKNTLLYRLTRIEQITHKNLKNPEDVLELQICLRLRAIMPQLRGPDVGK